VIHPASWPAAAARAIPLGDLAMDLILATAGGQWMVTPVPCACGCGRTGQAVKQHGPRSYLLLGHQPPKETGR
jgi:hypothetical protein